MNAVLPGQARSHQHDGMPAPRPARGRKSPSIQGFRSKAARRGPAAPDRACAAPRGRARAGGHSRAATSAAVLGGAWLVLKSTIRTSSGVTTSRSICPETSAGWLARPLQPADDRHLGAAAGGEHRRETRVRDQGQHAIGQRFALRVSPVVGVAGEIGKRGVAAALQCDIGQRLQQTVHQRAALERAGAQRE